MSRAHQLFLMSAGEAVDFGSIARPSSDITVTNLTAVGGSGGFYTRIDEETADDADYVYSANGTQPTVEFGLSTINSPGSGTCTCRWRAGKTNAGTFSNTQNAVTVTPSVWKDGVQVAAGSGQGLGAIATHSFTFNSSLLSAGTGLTIRFAIATSTGGTPGNRRGMGLTWAELETPGA